MAALELKIRDSKRFKKRGFNETSGRCTEFLAIGKSDVLGATTS